MSKRQSKHTKAKPRTKRPGEIAALMVTEQISAQIDFDWVLESPRWAALFASLLAELSSHMDVLTLVQEVKIQNRLSKRFDNQEDKQAFNELCEWHNTDAVTQCRAGFLVGYELGRRLGGAR
jgi:hypothetical protein